MQPEVHSFYQRPYIEPVFVLVHISLLVPRRWVHESGIATLIADALGAVVSHTLAEALLDVLLQFSCHQETARQVVMGTSIFCSLIRILREFQCKLTSVLLPSLLDLLWNLLDTMPKPRTLPNKVHIFQLLYIHPVVFSVIRSEHLILATGSGEPASF